MSETAREEITQLATARGWTIRQSRHSVRVEFFTHRRSGVQLTLSWSRAGALLLIDRAVIRPSGLTHVELITSKGKRARALDLVRNVPHVPTA